MLPAGPAPGVVGPGNIFTSLLHREDESTAPPPIPPPPRTSTHSSMTGFDNFQENALQAMDLELAHFASDLRSDPVKYSQYVDEQRKRLLKEAMEQKRAAFGKTSMDLYRYMDMENNAQLHSVRATEVSAMQAAVERSSAARAGASQQEVDSVRRQAEINEWYYGSKMEALFFLQLLLIATTLSVVLLLGVRRGGVSAGTATVLLLGAWGIALGVGVYRWRYTTYARDRRFWNKRRFMEDDDSERKSGSGCAKGGAFVLDLNDVVPPSLTKCAADVGGAMGRVSDAMDAEVQSAQEAGSNKPPSLCGA